MTAGEAASGFVLPLILGIDIFGFLALIVIMLAPSEDEILADALAETSHGAAGQPPRPLRQAEIPGGSKKTGPNGLGR